MTAAKEFSATEHGMRCDDVELIWAKNSKEFFFANSVVVHGEEPIVVDPSANFTYFERMAATGKTIRVLNTHYHTDHRALNGLFKKAVYHCHRADASALRSWPIFQKCLDNNPSSPYSEWVRRLWQQMNMHDTPVTVELEDGDVLNSERHELIIRHIPGHTPGLIALHFPDIDFLYTSDIDLTPMGPWYANTASDIDQFKQSIAKVRGIEVSHYATSHGMRVFTREQFLEKLDKFESHFQRREDKILELLASGPKTVPELAAAGVIYRRALMGDPLHQYFAERMIEKHLESLTASGQIEAAAGHYSLKS